MRRLLLLLLLFLFACSNHSGCSSGSGTGTGGGTGAGNSGGTGNGGGGGGGNTTTPVQYSGAFPQVNPGTTLSASVNLTVSGATRRTELYVPASRGAQPPLLITLHGTSGSGIDWIDPTAGSDPAGLEDLSEQRGFIVVSPWARSRTDPDWDNHQGGDVYWQTYPDTNPETNVDLVFIRALIQEARRVYSVDPNRIYVLGHSNGGFFAITVAMALQDQIAAFAENSSGLVRCDTTAGCTFRGSGTSCGNYASQAGYCSCSGPEKPVTIASSGHLPPGYLTHNADDDMVSVYYTCELASRMRTLGYSTTVILQSSGGHSLPDNYAANVWNFFLGQSL